MADWTVISQREAAAYHEAGHVVVAYLLGWTLNDEGAEIDDRQYTGLRRQRFLDTTARNVMIRFAGWLAEHRYHGHGGARRTAADSDVPYLLQCLLSVLDEIDDETMDGDQAGACPVRH
jgi:hypothetical protein